jgi:hypothetical protein
MELRLGNKIISIDNESHTIVSISEETSRDDGSKDITIQVPSFGLFGKGE